MCWESTRSSGDGAPRPVPCRAHKKKLSLRSIVTRTGAFVRGPPAWRAVRGSTWSQDVVMACQSTINHLILAVTDVVLQEKCFSKCGLPGEEDNEMHKSWMPAALCLISAWHV